MSNKPNFRRATPLAEYASKRREEGSIEIPLSKGKPIVVPPREFWPAEALKLADRQRSRKDPPTDETVARAVIGDDDFDRFVVEARAAGVNIDPGVFFWRYLTEQVTEQQGVTPGE